jgi:hypothetical protein
MRFPRQFGILLARISLERFMSPELANETLAEIRKAIDELTEWWNQGHSELPNEGLVQNPDQAESAFSGPAGELLADDQNGEILGKIPVEKKDVAIAYATSVIAEVRTRAQPTDLKAEELVDILTTKLPDSSNYYVIWIDHNQIDGNPGRYVHFSWNRDGNQVNYVIRDILSRTMFSPIHAPRSDSGWTAVLLDLTAGAIWTAAARRYPIANSTGLSGIRGVGEYPDRWKIVLDIMTKLMPPSALVSGPGPNP